MFLIKIIRTSIFGFYGWKTLPIPRLDLIGAFLIFSSFSLFNGQLTGDQLIFTHWDLDFWIIRVHIPNADRERWNAVLHNDKKSLAVSYVSSTVDTVDERSPAIPAYMAFRRNVGEKTRDECELFHSFRFSNPLMKTCILTPESYIFISIGCILSFRFSNPLMKTCILASESYIFISIGCRNLRNAEYTPNSMIHIMITCFVGC